MENPEDSVTLRLCCRTQGKGDEDLLVVDKQTLPAHSGTNTHDVHVKIPEAVETPVSFRGNLIALEWALELAIMPTEEKRGFLGIKRQSKEQVQRLPLVISPTGDILRP